jgi:hypothetical protein
MSLAVAVVVVVVLAAMLASSRRHTTPVPDAAPFAALAEGLPWRDGATSPNGRRVLWVEPAATTLMSATTHIATAAYFGAGCPVDPDALRARLPDAPVEARVAWPLTRDEVARVERGFRPLVMEDKWRIETLDIEGGQRVFMLRSWTGMLLYALDLDERGVTRVWSSSDDPCGPHMARAVFEGYLLGRPCVVPAPKELGDDKAKLLLFGIQMAGRRCQAVEPGAAG